MKIQSDFYNRKTLVVIIGIYFLFGFSTLLYQVVWQRMLLLFSGSDIRSATIVIGSFLAGIGIGNLIAGFYVDRLNNRQLIWAFGLCNFGIALFAFLSRLLFYDILFVRLNTLSNLPFIELMIVFISLLWPTTLMGLTLPLLSKALVRSLKSAARLITWLFAFNTLGAATGTFFCCWFLIGTIGYEYAAYVGGVLNTLIAIIALSIAGKFGVRNTDNKATLNHPRVNSRFVPRSVLVWCILVFTSGFIAISLELIWFRVIDVILESTAYTFGHLLGFILLGYAVGGLFGSYFLDRISIPRSAFLWIQGLTALYSILAIWCIAAAMNNDFLGSMLTASKHVIEPKFLPWAVGYFLLPAAILLPPNMMIGACFPIIQKAVQTDMRLVGQRVSLVQLSNITGNVIGSILTGLFLIHFVGAAGSLRIIGLLGLILILVLIFEQFLKYNRRSLILGSLLACSLFISMIFFPDLTTFWRKMHRVKADHLFVVTEDSSGVFAICEKDNLGKFYANGELQGGVPYFEIHTVLGALPALIHPHPKRIMTIGIGSTGTPHAVGINPLTEQIVAVEILGAELPVLKTYAQEKNGRPIKAFFKDNRYEIVVGDGRRELDLRDTKFDIIQADAIYPWRSRSGLLYSREFFEKVRDRLKDGGIMSQWSPTKRIEATFVSMFPYVLLFNNDILLGSNQPIPYDSNRLRDRLTNDPHVTRYFKKAQMTLNVDEIKVIQVWTPDSPRKSYDINTDLFPKDEYYLNN